MILNLSSITLHSILDILESISIITATVIAIYSINSWRKETKWKRRYEIAEEVLSLFYEARQRFRQIRSPLIWESEGKTRKINSEETVEEAKILDSGNIVFERYQKYKETFIKLETLKYRFMTIFGVENEVYFDEINKHLNSLFGASRFIAGKELEIFQSMANKNERKELLKEIAPQRKILYSFAYDGKTKDDFEVEVDDLISRVENVCKGIIQENYY